MGVAATLPELSEWTLRNFVVFSLTLLLIFEYALPPNLNLRQNAYSIFPHIHVKRESMARGTRHTGTLQLCQSLVNGL